MFFLYNLLVAFAGFCIKILAVFNPKMRQFLEGRKMVFETLATRITAKDKTIWFHAASLGEYEQGLPVMEKMKVNYPNHKIIIKNNLIIKKYNKQRMNEIYNYLNKNSIPSYVMKINIQQENNLLIKKNLVELYITRKRPRR